MDDRTAQQAKTLANFVWQIAEILRGDFKQPDTIRNRSHSANPSA
jgi:type I restriction enzyme M protein